MPKELLVSSTSSEQTHGSHLSGLNLWSTNPEAVPDMVTVADEDVSVVIVFFLHRWFWWLSKFIGMLSKLVYLCMFVWVDLHPKMDCEQLSQESAIFDTSMNVNKRSMAALLSFNQITYFFYLYFQRQTKNFFAFVWFSSVSFSSVSFNTLGPRCAAFWHTFNCWQGTLSHRTTVCHYPWFSKNIIILILMHFAKCLITAKLRSTVFGTCWKETLGHKI